MYGFPSDAWSVGIVLFELIQDDASHSAVEALDGPETFADTHPGFLQRLQALAKADEGHLGLGLCCAILMKNPDKRFTPENALRHLFLVEFDRRILTASTTDLFMATLEESKSSTCLGDVAQGSPSSAVTPVPTQQEQATNSMLGDIHAEATDRLPHKRPARGRERSIKREKLDNCVGIKQEIEPLIHPHTCNQVQVPLAPACKDHVFDMSIRVRRSAPIKVG
jgi:hypothetical protein